MPTYHQVSYTTNGKTRTRSFRTDGLAQAFKDGLRTGLALPVGTEVSRIKPVTRKVPKARATTSTSMPATTPTSVMS